MSAGISNASAAQAASAPAISRLRRQSAAGDQRPIVIYGEYDDNMHAQVYLADGPAADIVRHLAQLGHRRFLHVAGSEDWASALNRRAVYEQMIAQLGLESYGVVVGDWSVASGYEAARDLPADSGVSVFGWDDEQFTQYFRPSMSTARLDRDTMGRQAMSSLLALINGEQQPALRFDSTFEIVPRGSSGPAPR